MAEGSPAIPPSPHSYFVSGFPSYQVYLTKPVVPGRGKNPAKPIRFQKTDRFKTILWPFKIGSTGHINLIAANIPIFHRGKADSRTIGTDIRRNLLFKK